jgi:hypothetical protein
MSYEQKNEFKIKLGEKIKELQKKEKSLDKASAEDSGNSDNFFQNHPNSFFDLVSVEPLTEKQSKQEQELKETIDEKKKLVQSMLTSLIANTKYINA